MMIKTMFLHGPTYRLKKPEYLYFYSRISEKMTMNCILINDLKVQ